MAKTRIKIEEAEEASNETILSFDSLHPYLARSINAKWTGIRRLKREREKSLREQGIEPEPAVETINMGVYRNIQERTAEQRDSQYSSAETHTQNLAEQIIGDNTNKSYNPSYGRAG